ncbi:MAG: hypothetical protein HPY50_15920 [Firmicutes bacterium]|nr:hypothetical protein [Bacillota bacterium]
MEEKARPRRRNVSIKIDQTLNYDFPREERKRRGPSVSRSFFSGLTRAIKAPFSAIVEASHYRKEIKRAEANYQRRDPSRQEPVKLISTDNIYWKLIYPLPVSSELEKISSDLERIRSRLKGFDTEQLRYLRIHAQGVESRFQVVWAIYVILLFAIGLYGHSYINQPYFLAFFLLCLLAVIVLFYRYVRSRFLVTIVREVINDILSEDKKTTVQ